MTADALPPKVDPETLTLRARPPRAIRFRRSAIIALTATGAAALLALAWTAFEPVSLPRDGDAPKPAEPQPQGAADALEALPESYADVPRLRPPLPGDSGRPILAEARASSDPEGGVGPAAEAARAERDRRLAEMRAARESPLLFNDRAAPAVPPVDPGPVAVALSPDAAPSAPDAMRETEGQRPRTVAPLDAPGGVNPHRLVPPASPHVLSAGSVIAASLITGLRSDLPGLVTAQVTEPVYDSPTGRTLLIPQGTRLVGRYDSVVAFGQKRVLVAWQRLILPDGSSLALGNVPATDAAGHAGLADRVDFHSWSLLKGVALSTLMGVAPELVLASDGDLVEAIRRSTADSGARAADQVVAKNLAIQPTISVRLGTPVRLVVRQDLVLPPWKG